MEFKVGDLVTRNSYSNDIVFSIIEIKEEICYLKGISFRLYADSPLTDLKKYEEDSEKNEQEFIERSKPNFPLDRNDYFYLPGKILHIDADRLCNSEFEKVL